MKCKCGKEIITPWLDKGEYSKFEIALHRDGTWTIKFLDGDNNLKESFYTRKTWKGVLDLLNNGFQQQMTEEELRHEQKVSINGNEIADWLSRFVGLEKSISDIMMKSFPNEPTDFQDCNGVSIPLERKRWIDEYKNVLFEISTNTECGYFFLEFCGLQDGGRYDGLGFESYEEIEQFLSERNIVIPREVQNA